MPSLAGGGGWGLWRFRSTLGEEPSWGKLGVPLKKDIVWKLNSPLGDKEPWECQRLP